MSAEIIFDKLANSITNIMQEVSINMGSDIIRFKDNKEIVEMMLAINLSRKVREDGI